MSGLFSCPNQKASFQLEVNHFAAMIMVATSMPKEIINDNTLNVLILITANPRVDQQRLDPFRGLNFNIVPLIIKVNRLEVPNSHLCDQQEPLSSLSLDWFATQSRIIKPPDMRVRQRKLYKKITLLKYNVGVQAALYAKER